MKKSSAKNFLFVNLPAFTTTAEVVEILKDECVVRDVRVRHDPTTAISRFYAYIILVESIQPYYLPTFLENIRRKSLSGRPVSVIPLFMGSPAEANRIFDAICQLICASDPDEFRKAEMLAYELAAKEKQVRRLGTQQLIEFLTTSCVGGNIDLQSVEKRITDFLNSKPAKEKIETKPKSKPKKKKKRRSLSVKAISIPMGGQPGWRRR